jgi:hypothetical protein
MDDVVSKIVPNTQPAPSARHTPVPSSDERKFGAEPYKPMRWSRYGSASESLLTIDQRFANLQQVEVVTTP